MTIFEKLLWCRTAAAQLESLQGNHKRESDLQVRLEFSGTQTWSAVVGYEERHAPTPEEAVDNLAEALRKALSDVIGPVLATLAEKKV